jgi:hypothetical protein
LLHDGRSRVVVVGFGQHALKLKKT